MLASSFPYQVNQVSISQSSHSWPLTLNLNVCLVPLILKLLCEVCIPMIQSSFSTISKILDSRSRCNLNQHKFDLSRLALERSKYVSHGL